MTKNLANIRDFYLVEDDDRNDVAFQFRFGKCDDFRAAFQAFKDAIPIDDRKPNVDKNWLWRVVATEQNRAQMERLFDNFQSLYEECKFQMRMF